MLVVDGGSAGQGGEEGTEEAMTTEQRREGRGLR